MISVILVHIDYSENDIILSRICYSLLALLHIFIEVHGKLGENPIELVLLSRDHVKYA